MSLQRSPVKKVSSDNELCGKSERSSLEDLSFKRKRKHDDILLEAFQSLSIEIRETINNFKIEMNLSLQDLKNDINSLKESTTHFKAEIGTIKSNYEKLKQENVNMIETLDYNSMQMKELENKNDEMQCEYKKVLCNIEEIRNQNRLLKLEINSNDQRERLLNLEFIGIPEYNGEVLMKYILQIGKKIGVNLAEEDIIHINRVTPKVKQQGRPRVVVAKFKTRLSKDQILSFSRKTRVSTKDLNILGEGKPIYINEHLTLFNKQLLKQCKEIAKIKQYQFIWTKNCRIFVRKNDVSAVFQIRTEEDLKRII